MPSNYIQQMNHPPRNYYDFHKHGKVVAQVDRTYANEILVLLPCGYRQRFWGKDTDNEAVRTTLKMKDLGVDSD